MNTNEGVKRLINISSPSAAILITFTHDAFSPHTHKFSLCHPKFPNIINLIRVLMGFMWKFLPLQKIPKTLRNLRGKFDYLFFNCNGEKKAINFSVINFYNSIFRKKPRNDFFIRFI